MEARDCQSRGGNCEKILSNVALSSVTLVELAIILSNIVINPSSLSMSPKISWRIPKIKHASPVDKTGRLCSTSSKVYTIGAFLIRSFSNWSVKAWVVPNKVIVPEWRHSWYSFSGSSKTLSSSLLTVLAVLGWQTSIITVNGSSSAFQSRSLHNLNNKYGKGILFQLLHQEVVKRAFLRHSFDFPNVLMRVSQCESL